MIKFAKLTVLVILTFCISNTINAKEEISLNGDWDFTFKEGLSEDVPELPATAEYDIKLAVPDYINFQTDRLIKAKWWKGKKRPAAYVDLKGTGFYRSFFDVPADWKNRSVQLYIGMAYYRINIWANGKHIACYPHASLTPFTVDLSSVLKPGERNEIVISTDNTKEMQWVHGRPGGIVSKVSLLISNGPGAIDDLYLRPGETSEDIVWQISLKTQSSNPVADTQLKWKIRDWDSKKQIAEGIVPIDTVDTKGITKKWGCRSNSLKPWSPDAPNLYIAELSWERNGVVIDSLVQRFGLRKWTSEDKCLKLNGVPIYLRELIYTGYPHYRFPTDKDYWLRFLQLIKDAGYNGIVCFPRHFTASQELLDAADEIGVLVQSGSTHPTAALMDERIMNLHDMWRQIALWTRNHPSMSIYEMGVEMDYYDDFIKDAEKTCEIIKSINPESLFMPGQAMKGFEYNFRPSDTPKLTDTPFPHHPERLETLSGFSDVFGQYALGEFSYHALKTPWKKVNEWFEVYHRPLISHEVVMGFRNGMNIPDNSGFFPSLRFGPQSLDKMFCAYFWHGVKAKSEIDKILASQTVQEKADYENISRLHSIISKYILEKIRKCGNCTGYEDLGAHGGFNRLFMQADPGYSISEFRNFNNNSVLLLDFDNGNCLNRCTWQGDKFHAELMASLYEPAPLKRAAISWELYDGNNIIDRGFKQIECPANGKVSTLTDIKFNWPTGGNNRKLTLSARLSGFGCDISNSWDFWIFKRHSAPAVDGACSAALFPLLKRYTGLKPLGPDSTEKLWIVDRLTNNSLAHLQDGGNVLLLGGKPFVLSQAWRTFFFGYRNHHNHGSRIASHPVFAEIPNDGWGDWQFYPILENATPVIFKDRRVDGFSSHSQISPLMPLMKDIPFNPLLEILHIQGQAKQAVVFEMNAGKGRLFVSTNNFIDGNPVSVTLMDSIMKYMTEGKFKTAPDVDIKVLENLISCGKYEVVKTIEAEDLSPKTHVNIIKIAGADDKMAVTAKAPGTSIDTCVDLKEGDYRINILGCSPKSSTCVIIINGKRFGLLFGKKLSTESIDGIRVPADGKLKIEIQFSGVDSMLNKIEILRPVFAKNIVSSGSKDELKNGNDTNQMPLVVLISKNSDIEQLGGQAIADSRTIFEIMPKGKSFPLEVSIDEKDYTPYEGGFVLKPGLHSISCRRADDHRQAIFTDNCLEGNTISVQIRPEE